VSFEVLYHCYSGTPEERGIFAWRKSYKVDEKETSVQSSRMQLYDLPFVQPLLSRVNIFRYLPCCPTFMKREEVENTSIQNGDNGTGRDIEKNETQEDSAGRNKTGGHDNTMVTADSGSFEQDS